MHMKVWMLWVSEKGLMHVAVLHAEMDGCHTLPSMKQSAAAYAEAEAVGVSALCCSGLNSTYCGLGWGSIWQKCGHLQCADMHSEPTSVLDLQPRQLLLHLSQKALLAVRRTDARKRLLTATLQAALASP